MASFTPKDIIEETNRFFINLDNLDNRKNFKDVCGYIKEHWIENYLFKQPITTKVFFTIVENGWEHRCPATPERIKIIIDCLTNNNFDKIISENPLNSDDCNLTYHLTHVSSFGIDLYPT